MIWWKVADVKRQSRDRHVPQYQQQQQQQQQAPSNIVYVQVPARDARPRWTGEHYLRKQSICLGSILVIVGSLSVIGNVVLAVSSNDSGGDYLMRAILCGTMVSMVISLSIISLSLLLKKKTWQFTTSYKDDGSKVAELKQQISQKMILPKCHCASK